ncbi:MAG: deoxyhypusine synthase [Theionarchaea archaeon]|nr:deoxyhypusine synthase [Theionarchaea archaeon]
MNKKIFSLEMRKGMSVKDLINEYEKGVFGAGKIAEAVNIYTDMLNRKCRVFLGLAGALVPAGLGKVIADLVRDDMVHVIVSTGANITHDLIEAFGGCHLKEISGHDSELREKGIDRIYDAFIEDESFAVFEEKINEILQKMESKLTVSDFLREIGKNLEFKDSIVRQAYLRDVPIFVPALTDSILGLHTFLYSQEHALQIDHVKDVQKIVGLTTEKAGAIFLGGGVPKNFIFQAMLLSPRSFEYALQITTDRPEYGGLSGATLEEAISWGKVSEDSRLCTVYCDATIAFPLIVAGVRDRQ